MKTVSSAIKDIVVKASSSTFKKDELFGRGLKMTISKIPPEITLWKGRDKVYVEFIETPHTMESSLKKWKEYSKLDIDTTLVIPEDSLEEVRVMLSTERIFNFHLQTYALDNYLVSVTFTNVS